MNYYSPQCYYYVANMRKRTVTKVANPKKTVTKAAYKSVDENDECEIKEIIRRIRKLDNPTR